MKQYEKEVLQAYLDNEKAVLKKLEEVYEGALADIEDRIADLLGRNDSDLKHVVYQVEFQKSLKKQIETILDNLHNQEFENIAEYLTYSYEEGFVGTLYSLQQQGIPLVFPINQEQVAEAIQHDTKISTKKNTKTGKLYASLGEDITDLKKKIAGEISRGFAGSMSYAKIAANIALISGIPKNNAMTIARTEMHRIQTKASMDTCYKAREKKAEVIKFWDSTLDSRTRDSHMRVDGEQKELDEKFSNGLLYPGDPDGPAEEVINCRCALLQKARWALDAEETKYLGNVDEMSEKRKKEIAKKLKIPVKDLKDYSKQVVPIKAKNYKEFKKRYKELWQYEGSELQKQAEERIAGYKGKKEEKVEKTDKSSKIGAEGNGIREVFFDENNDYSVVLEGIDEKVNEKLSQGIREVARLGSKDRNEHMFLVDLDDKLTPYYETNGMSNMVGYDFWEYAKKHPDSQFAFIHNHNTDTSFSQTDLETPIYAKNIPVQIAVTNEGVKYVARRIKNIPENYIPDEYFAKELEELNRKSRANEITPVERMIEREKIITELLINEFYGRIEIIDGRK